MNTKEKVKHEIDTLPDKMLDDILTYIKRLKKHPGVKRSVHTYKLDGRFDSLNVREKAHE